MAAWRAMWRMLSKSYSLHISNQSQHPFLLSGMWYGNVEAKANPELTDPSLVTERENNLLIREGDGFQPKDTLI